MKTPEQLCDEYNEAHPDEPPFVPWTCDQRGPPSDWDGDLALWRDNAEIKPDSVADDPFDWTYTNGPNIVGYRPKPDFALTHSETYVMANADTVTIGRMTEFEARKAWQANTPAPAPSGHLVGWLAAYVHLGIIRPEPTPRDRARETLDGMFPSDAACLPTRDQMVDAMLAFAEREKSNG